MKQKTLKKLVLSGLIAALVFVTTAFFPLPLPGGGYANFGDCFVILAGLLLGPVYGSLAAAVGAALSDLILGYGVYIPATFIIKGLMALIVAIVAGRSGLSFRFWRIALSAALAEFTMVGGYLIFELFLYGGGAVAAVLGNSMQGVVGLISSVLLALLLHRTGLLSRLRGEGTEKF